MDSTQRLNNEARKQRRQRRLGDNARCLLCDQADPVALRTVPRTLLEQHHVGGRANDADTTAVLCRNCHAVVTEGQRDAGVDLSRDDGRSPPARLLEWLRSLLVLAEQLIRRAWQLVDDATDWLDDNQPGWRYAL